MWDNFWAKLFLTIFGAQNWAFGGYRAGGWLWQPGRPPPPSVARYGVLYVRLGHFER